MLLWEFVQIFAGGEGGGGAIARGGCDLPNGLGTAVASHENAWCGGQAILASHDVAVLVKRAGVGKWLVFGGLADGDEDAVHIKP